MSIKEDVTLHYWDAVQENKHLRWSLTIALAERDDALWMLAKVNGRAQEATESDDEAIWARCFDAIHDIRAMCEQGLRR